MKPDTNLNRPNSIIESVIPPHPNDDNKDDDDGGAGAGLDGRRVPQVGALGVHGDAGAGGVAEERRVWSDRGPPVGGAASERDPEAAARLYEAACREGSAYACEAYALDLREGSGVKKNKAKSREYLAKSCRLDPDGCRKHTGRFGAGGG